MRLSVPNSVTIKIFWLTKTSEQSFKLQLFYKLRFTFLFWGHNNLLFWHQINRKKLQLSSEESYISEKCHLTIVNRQINYFRSQEIFWTTALSVTLFHEYVVFLLILFKIGIDFQRLTFDKTLLWTSLGLNIAFACLSILAKERHYPPLF